MGMGLRRAVRAWTGALACASLLGAASAAQAQQANTPEQEIKQAWAAAKTAAQPGPIAVTLRDQAKLNIGAGEVFIPQPAAGQLMQAMGNRNNPDMLGLVMPTNGAEWMVVAKYEASGYIKDDDAKDWNVDELFNSIKEGTTAANEEREKRGIPALEIQGWVERPHYDAATHRLIWSMAARSKGQPANEPESVNYNTYALGREGYISLNLITARDHVDADKPTVQALLARLDFQDGKRYTDFNSKTDKVAEYGLAALVGGIAAKKLGLFAVIAAFLAKFAKVAILAVAGFGATIAKLFKRKSST
ncbi:DUF2167 domain-containing protein [Ralstonia solanacearum]|uniref:DUF2167 domain-containing protein n=1 Tax=Ralstonia solanacearum TaxID=305 RepID=UPI000F60A112|nr:DUF2167 domain-containing protein [Ralstonia solanacearum]MCL9844807.1 DUF2167 domain-containing protein [Ralstonia solanacearum]MDC6252972.1 DUF2167 domain-containing protein [Ralstonia solanacearum]MDC6257554.1 DUF2167 domain-containing protein [Ralstonia solanacearum]MDC6301790.1 DUF2167 domain-containing protein [Ralstonia solanacearum]